ncbi:MAG: clostripain-related cysteine peptidase, partial [bacterium]
MLRQFLTAILAIIVTLLLAFTATAAEWTIMVYIGADNNLSSFINGDVDEMEEAGSTSEVNIVCQIDGKASYGGYNDYLGNWSTVRRYYIQAGNPTNNSIDGGFISDLGDLNSANPDVLRDFAIWAINTYPAERYMLVLWNHGGGWARPAPPPSYKAIIWDDTNGDGSGIGFSNGEYANMLSEIYDHLGKSISIVGFDACIVGMLETEYETMGYADYLVHSEANVPGDGWDYDFLVSLTADPYCSEEQVINWLIDEYATYYSSSSVTMSGLRLDHDHNDYQMAIADFGRELILAGGKSNTSITTSISAARD